ncbi:MAG: translocation/assembly module TamB domain-containing protein [Legionellaceae bacterium]|nr:translocation/assembly module TamB domain-containing protein [Legionellaceae bacterium]
MKFTKRLIYSLLMLGVILIALLSFIITTNTGLYLLLYLGKQAAPGKLTYQKVGGSLSGPLHIQKLEYSDSTQSIQIEQLKLRWTLRQLWHKKLSIQLLKAERVHIQTREDSTDEDPTPLQWPHLPLTIDLQKLAIAQLDIDNLNIHSLSLAAHLDEENWQLQQASLIMQDTRMQLHGHMQPKAPFESRANIQFSPVKEAQTSTLRGYLSFSGNWQHYQWQGVLRQPLPLRIHGQLRNLQQLDHQMEWQAFPYPLSPQKTLHIEKGRFSMTGRYPHFNFNLQAAQQSPVKANLRVQGHTDLQRLRLDGLLTLASGDLHLQMEADNTDKAYISGQLSGSQLDLQAFDIPVLIQHLDARFNTRKGRHAKVKVQARYQERPFTGSLTLHDDRIDAQVQQQRNRITASGKLSYPMAIELMLPEPASLHPELQGLDTRISGQIQLLAANRGEARLHIAPGSWQNQGDATIPPLHFEGGTIQAQLNPQGLTSQGKLIIDSAKTLQLQLDLPGFDPGKVPNAQQRLRGNLDLEINDLAFLQEISPDITKAEGQLLAKLTLSGQLLNPDITGSMELRQGSLGLRTMGINLDPIAIRVDTAAKTWNISGTIGHAPGQLLLSGKGQFSPQPQGNIQLTGQNFRLVDTSEYVIYISPDVRLQLAEPDYILTGNIQIPKAEIKPQTFSSSVSLTDDAVFADELAEEESLSRFKSHLNIVMGDAVHLNVQGLTARIIGSLVVQQESSSPMNASGQLSVVDGKYQAYGQNLQIQQGELIFTGGQIQNPGINVRAARSFSTTGATFAGSNRLFDFGASNVQPMSFSSQTTVGIQISGQLNTPKVTLFSVPGNLSQADILSMLLLGRPANQASGAGGQLLIAAMSSMNLGGGTKGTQLLSQLQQALGLDFSIDTQSTYNQQSNTVSEQHRLGISKTVSNRLSISYNTGLSHLDSNGISLRYLLNRYFNIQVTAGLLGSGIDLVYTHQQE